VIQNDRSAYLMTLTAGENGNKIVLYQSLFEKVTPIAEAPLNAGKRDGGTIFLRVTGDYMDYQFSFSMDSFEWQALGGTIDGAALSPAVLGGFNYTGAYIGLYASSNGAPAENHADFEFFSYRPQADDRDDWFYRQLRRSSSE